MDIYEHFKKDKIIENLSVYESYYQISLGKLAHLSNAKDFNSEIELTHALGSIYELIKDIQTIKNDDDISLDFFEELKKQSSMDALQFFANEHLELIKNGVIDIEVTLNTINDDVFFDTQMKNIHIKNIDFITQKWNKVITEELALQIINSLNELENKN